MKQRSEGEGGEGVYIGERDRWRLERQQKGNTHNLNASFRQCNARHPSIDIRDVG